MTSVSSPPSQVNTCANKSLQATKLELTAKLRESIRELRSEFCLRFHLSSSLRRCLEYTRPINKKQVSLLISPENIHTLGRGADDNVLLLTLDPSAWHFFQLPRKPLRLTFQYQDMYELLRSVNKERHRRVAEAKAKAKQTNAQNQHGSPLSTRVQGLQGLQQSRGASSETGGAGEASGASGRRSSSTHRRSVLQDFQCVHGETSSRFDAGVYSDETTGILNPTPLVTGQEETKTRRKAVKGLSVAKSRAKAKAKARAKAKLKSMSNSGKLGKQEVPFYITLRDNRLFCALGFAAGSQARPISKCTRWIELDSTDQPSFDLSRYGSMTECRATVRVPIKWFRKTVVDSGVGGSFVQLEISANRLVIRSAVTPRMKLVRHANHNGHISRSDGCLITILDKKTGDTRDNTNKNGKRLALPETQRVKWITKASIIQIEKFLRPCSASDFVTIGVTRTPFLLLQVYSTMKGTVGCLSEYHMRMLQEWEEIVEEPTNLLRPMKILRQMS